MSHQHFSGTLHILQCANCSMHFGITKDFEERRRKDHKEFYCPAGHSNVYNHDNEEEKLRRENQRMKQNSAYLEDQIRDREKQIQKQRENTNAARRQTRAYKGVVTRTKNRVGAGVCPCCTRSFKSLAAHMATKHPEYRKEKVSAT